MNFLGKKKHPHNVRAGASVKNRGILCYYYYFELVLIAFKKLIMNPKNLTPLIEAEDGVPFLQSIASLPNWVYRDRSVFDRTTMLKLHASLLPYPPHTTRWFIH